MDDVQSGWRLSAYVQDNLKTHVEGILTAHPQPPPCPSEQQKQNGWVSPF